MSITLDGTTGITTPGLTNTGTETIVNLTTTGNTILGDASTDTLNVGNGGLVKDASGNVGIGTASPSQKLEVANGFISTYDPTNANGAGYGLRFYTNANAGAKAEVARFGAIQEGATGINGAISFTTALAGVFAERMRIDSSGNVGVGVTPSAWLAQYKAIQLGASGEATGSLSFDNTNNLLQLSYNAYFNGNGTATRLVSGYATNYEQLNGTHRWSTAANTTGAITFTQAMTLDASGNLLVGSNALSNTRLNIALNSSTAYSSTDLAGYRGAYITNDTGGGFSNITLNTVDATGLANCLTTISAVSETSGSRNSSLTFATRTHTTGAVIERMRIDSSGNWWTGGATGAYGNQLGVAIQYSASATSMEISHATGSASGNYYQIYRYNAGLIGSITQSGTTAVLYNTTSDYRLKTDVAPIQNALQTITSLNPVSFNWIDGRPDDGFLAHELQEVLPNCVTGEKDAVNEDGTPKYQQMDNSGVVPFLVKAIQEQQALITSLTARLEVLEAK